MPLESLVLLLAAAALFFMMINRSRRQQREMQGLQQRLAVGSRIMTTAGLHATVVDLGEGTVVLETAPGQRSVWDRRAVARILPDDVPVADGPQDGAPRAAADGADGAGAAGTGPGTTQDGVPEPGAPSQDLAPPDRA